MLDRLGSGASDSAKPLKRSGGGSGLSNPAAGKPAVVLQGGPGSGCTPDWRTFFNPAAYRMVLFDQRGCGDQCVHHRSVATSGRLEPARAWRPGTE